MTHLIISDCFVDFIQVSLALLLMLYFVLNLLLKLPANKEKQQILFYNTIHIFLNKQMFFVRYM